MFHGSYRSHVYDNYYKEVLIKVTRLKIIYSIIDFSEKSDEYFTLINVGLMKIHRGWK